VFLDEAVPERYVATPHDAALLEQLDSLLASGHHRVADHYFAAKTR